MNTTLLRSAFGALAADARDEFGGEEIRTELHHHGKAARDVGVGGGESNGHARGEGFMRCCAQAATGREVSAPHFSGR